ncbi:MULTISPECIES: 2-amino-4-hydroxy-6-hydroxymethyldihydropteridine diphosphokinase [Maribacter]|uniref:2-amino-4-hydroxy-6-hydroxymethyldihydropteridine pyrophosphokinase n=1 Tax=Maribacter flavus TaxID=1658664 RepID=A0A5B2TVJ3_9FLAO|nr:MULTISPECIES: 2-amino-4-hydroxy-6-hydroxymethyldihydropteridine diphosphokinase [Maribacter]KAA2218507.1 2-amino-4-hydroxy-6-hydroxymethyldihydropteridine diphosphokinase [Maribacter flavus]MDC6404788.1 2-amino-4-hydroxy-6-hydroxymethyldihydropteridine diphosphokinase [Maribacter sp. PR66]MEE1972202.1 2-amino-4-hydroxy-6-hydroxymethyldihydropteridine diphosphokinase [Maribacter flavus]
MTESQRVYFSIGSNLGQKRNNLQKAIFMIGERIGDVTAVSSVYITPSWGFESDDFYNVCLEAQTTLKPAEVLEQLLAIEKQLGRERSLESGYQSRNIDLDIIYYETLVVDTDQLTLPHPRMAERKFVLKPLADIAPQFYHPIVNKDTRNLLQETRDKSEITKLPIKLFKNRMELFSDVQFLAIEGNIGAGKTSLATKISEDFNAKLILERFAENPFLPNFYKDKSRYAFPLEMSFLADRYQQYMDDTNQFDLFKNFMVSDYDIFKSLIFAKVTLQKDEFDLYRKIFNFMYKEVKKPRIYVYLYQTTERLLQQIKMRGRDYEMGIDGKYLEKINRGYLDFLRTYPQQNQLIMDVSELDFVNKQTDYKTILESISSFALQQRD